AAWARPVRLLAAAGLGWGRSPDGYSSVSIVPLWAARTRLVKVLIERIPSPEPSPHPPSSGEGGAHPKKPARASRTPPWNPRPLMVDSHAGLWYSGSRGGTVTVTPCGGGPATSPGAPGMSGLTTMAGVPGGSPASSDRAAGAVPRMPDGPLGGRTAAS